MEHMRELKDIKFMNKVLIALQIFLPLLGIRLYLHDVDLFSTLSFILMGHLLISYAIKQNKAKSFKLCKSIINK